MKTTPGSIAAAIPIAAAVTLAALAPAGAARADAKADALLKQVAAKTRATKTLSADLTLTMQPPGDRPALKSSGTVSLMRPNYARIVIADGPFRQTVASDGKTLYRLLGNNQYQKSDARPGGENVSLLWATPVTYFFQQNPSPVGGVPAATRYAGAETINGVRHDVVEVSGDKPAYSAKLYIGPERLLTRSVVTLTQGEQTTVYGAALSNLRVGRPMTAAAFAYEPPKTAKAYEPPNFEAKLVAIGKKAPEFSLPTPTGGTLALADAVKGNKATLINFWFYG